MPETIGQRLKNIRISRQLSLEKAAEATRVRAHYLHALESDNYSVMASAAQGRGFLRLYADFLNLDLEAAMDEMRAAEEIQTMQTDMTPVPASSPKGEPAPQTPPASPADGKPGRRGFWSRILRRPVPEPPVEAESAPEAGTPIEESPFPAPTLAAEPAPEPAPVRVKKTPMPVKSDKPKSKPKIIAQATGKKKQPLKTKPKR
jgi:cytoskeletal protein RodZ